MQTNLFRGTGQKKIFVLLLFAGTISLWFHFLGTSLTTTSSSHELERARRLAFCRARKLQAGTPESTSELTNSSETFNSTEAFTQEQKFMHINESEEYDAKLPFHENKTAKALSPAANPKDYDAKLPFHENKTAKALPPAANPAVPRASKPLKKAPPRKAVSRGPYKNVSCDNCFVRDFKYLNTPSDICGLESADGAPMLDMVMTILSRPSNRLVRDVVRATWASATKNNTSPSTRHVFLLGAIRDPHEQELIDKESKKYNDIVQQSFKDHYDNLTLKSLMMYDWATSKCHNARYIFKVDEDVFVNVSRVAAITRLGPTHRNILGRCQLRSGPIRNEQSKWVLPASQYPQNTYPPFCLGPRYLVPMEVAKAVLAVSPNTPMIRLEDVYLGMLLAKTPYGVKDTKEIDAGPKFSTSSKCSLVDTVTTKHGMRDVALSQIWKRCYMPGNPGYVRGREGQVAAPKPARNQKQKRQTPRLQQPDPKQAEKKAAGVAQVKNTNSTKIS